MFPTLTRSRPTHGLFVLGFALSVSVASVAAAHAGELDASDVEEPPVQATPALLVAVASVSALEAAGAMAPAVASSGSAVAPTTPVALPEPEKPAESSWLERVKVEGVIDTFASVRSGGSLLSHNEFRAFDLANGTFHLGYAELAITSAEGPAGLRLDLGFGPGADLASMDTPDPAGPPVVSDIFKNIQQAYATFELSSALGAEWPTKLTLDVGKFTTTAGAELIEAKENWAYSRSMLFLTGPYSHTGARLTAELSEAFSVQASVVNGWESINDNNQSKTLGISASYTAPSKTAFTLTSYQGVESSTSAAWQQFYDLVVAHPFSDQLALNVNAALGMGEGGRWYGAAAMLHYVPADFLTLTLRGERFEDPDGLKSGHVDAAGDAAGLGITAATLTAGIPVGRFTELRFEGRYDRATARYFHGGTRHSQTTGQIAALAWF